MSKPVVAVTSPVHNIPAAKTAAKPKAPVKLAMVVGIWMITRSQGDAAAGSIPASPWEIELWVYLLAARREIAELRARIKESKV